MNIKELKKTSEKYLERLKLRGKSKNTIRQYRAGIKTLLSFLDKNHIEEFDLEAIDKYRNYLELRAKGKIKGEQKIKYSTLNAKGTALSGLLKYIDDPTLLEAEDIKIKTQQKFKECLTEEEYNKLLMFAEVENKKFYLLWKYIGSTGLRISEALSLTADQIKECERQRGSNKGVIEVLGKGKKLRDVRIPKEIRSELIEYIEENHIENYVFHSTKIEEVEVTDKNGIKKTVRKKVIDDSKHVNRSVAYKALTRLAKKIGIDPKFITPHLLRHYWSISQLKNSGNDLEALLKLSKQLGHSSIDTTRIYLEMRDNREQEEEL